MDNTPVDLFQRDMGSGRGPFRGEIELPGPGIYEIDCLVSWSLTLL